MTSSQPELLSFEPRKVYLPMGQSKRARIANLTEIRGYYESRMAAIQGHIDRLSGDIGSLQTKGVEVQGEDSNMPLFPRAHAPGPPLDRAEVDSIPLYGENPDAIVPFSLEIRDTPFKWRLIERWPDESRGLYFLGMQENAPDLEPYWVWISWNELATFKLPLNGQVRRVHPWDPQLTLCDVYPSPPVCSVERCPPAYLDPGETRQMGFRRFSWHPEPETNLQDSPASVEATRETGQSDTSSDEPF